MTRTVWDWRDNDVSDLPHWLVNIINRSLNSLQYHLPLAAAELKSMFKGEFYSAVAMVTTMVKEGMGNAVQLEQYEQGENVQLSSVATNWLQTSQRLDITTNLTSSNDMA